MRLGDLLDGRRKLVDVAQRKAGAHERSERRRDGAVIFDDAFGELVCPELTLNGIAIDRPGLAALLVGDPMWMRGRHEDRMLDGEPATRARRRDHEPVGATEYNRRRIRRHAPAGAL
jgi:hypothetical protein